MSSSGVTIDRQLADWEKGVSSWVKKKRDESNGPFASHTGIYKLLKTCLHVDMSGTDSQLIGKFTIFVWFNGDVMHVRYMDGINSEESHNLQAKAKNDDWRQWGDERVRLTNDMVEFESNKGSYYSGIRCQNVQEQVSQIKKDTQLKREKIPTELSPNALE